MGVYVCVHVCWGVGVLCVGMVVLLVWWEVVFLCVWDECLHVCMYVFACIQMCACVENMSKFAVTSPDFAVTTH